jgi:dolichol-phosphate mannosyltransferase
MAAPAGPAADDPRGQAMNDLVRDLEGWRLPGSAAPATRPLDLAVVVPVLNERDNVPVLVAALEATLAGLAWEVIFVDDGSRDGTPAAIENLAACRRDIRLIRRHGRRGLSTAVVEGIMATLAPIIAVMDGDLQHDEAILPALYRAVASGRADVAVGTRYAAGGSVGSWAPGRVRASALATHLAQRIARTPLSDPMSGFFCIRRASAMASLPGLSSVGFKILLDLLMSNPERLRVAEVPYRFRTRAAGASKLDLGVAVDFLVLLVDKLTSRFVPPRLILFGAVGGLGLMVHLTLLKGLLDIAPSFKVAQITAVLAAIAFNFMLNNMLTYRDRRLTGAAFWRGLLSFYAVCGLGGVANVGIADLVYAGGSPWWAAGIAGAGISALWNYTASSLFTWRRG